jgi:hypothetical protein
VRNVCKSVTRRRVGFAIVAALGVSVSGESAFASDFTYSSYSVVDEVNVTISGKPSGPVSSAFEDGTFGSGQIVLYGSGLDLSQTLDVWCIDATHMLQGSGTYQIISSNFTNNGANNGSAGGTVIGSSVLGEIGALVNWGDRNINSTGTLQGLSLTGLVSAATQLAIWTIEYPGGNATFSSANSAVNTLVTTLVSDAENPSLFPAFAPDISLLEVVDPNNGDNQGLVYLAPTPLPAALPLFATGLSAFGLLGWRRKRKASLPTLATA